MIYHMVGEDILTLKLGDKIYSYIYDTMPKTKIESKFHRTVQLTIRVTAAEHRLLLQARRKSQARTLTDHVRDTVLANARQLTEQRGQRRDSRSERFTNTDGSPLRDSTA